MAEAPKQLKPYLFKKGVSGNPSGRPKDTLKEFARKYFKDLTDEEKMKFLNSISPEVVWKMGEGNAPQSTDITSKGKALQITFDSAFNETKTSEANQNIG